MIHRLIGAAVAALVLTGPAVADGSDSNVMQGRKKRAHKSFYDFKVKDIDGKEVSLSKYKGEVCLVVNVASK